MALDISPPNYSGLAGLASQGPRNIDLTVPGALGLQALQITNAHNAANQQAALEQERIQSQNQQALMQRDYQNRMLQQQGLLAQSDQNLKAQQLAQQGQLGQGELDYKNNYMDMMGQYRQDEINARNQATAVAQSKVDMQRLLTQNKQDIQDRGAFASYGLLALNQAKTPDEAAQIKNELLSEATSKGYLSEDESKAAAQMPLSQFKNSLSYKIMQYGQVKQYKDMVEANKPASTAATQIFDPTTGKLVYSSSPETPAATTETQKDLQDRELGLQQLGQIRDNFKSNYFTYPGQAALWASKQAEKLQGIPGLGSAADLAAGAATGMDTNQRADYIRNATDYLNGVEQFFNKYRKEITGAAAGEKELADLKKSSLNEDMSPSELMGALDQLVSKYTSDAEFKKNVLNKGLNTTPGTSPDSGLINYLKQKGYSDDMINQALQGAQ